MLSALASAAVQTDSLGAVLCVCTGQEGSLDTLRLNLYDTLEEISFNEATRVNHGWAFPFMEGTQAMPPDMLRLPLDEVCHLLLPYCLFQMTLNGSPIAPDFCALASLIYGWHLGWYYMFPPGYFAPGIHVLTGTWTVSNMPVRYRPGWEDIADEHGLVTRFVTRTLTLVVTY
jgi:hypothetical protein